MATELDKMIQEAGMEKMRLEEEEEDKTHLKEVEKK
jgi:hypothetical protein